MKRTALILGSMALFGVVSLAIANNAPSTNGTQEELTEQTLSEQNETFSAETELVSGMADRALDKAVEEGVATQSQKDLVKNSKIIEKTFQALVDNDFEPAAAVDKAAEVAVEQGWARDKASAKSQLRNEIEKARKNESLINKFYNILGI